MFFSPHFHYDSTFAFLLSAHPQAYYSNSKYSLVFFRIQEALKAQHLGKASWNSMFIYTGNFLIQLKIWREVIWPLWGFWHNRSKWKLFLFSIALLSLSFNLFIHNDFQSNCLILSIFSVLRYIKTYSNFWRRDCVKLDYFFVGLLWKIFMWVGFPLIHQVHEISYINKRLMRGPLSATKMVLKANRYTILFD